MIGSAVCDMHYGLPEQAVNHVRVRCDRASLVVSKFIGRAGTNKIAYVAGERIGYTQCVYSYDNRYFGVFELPNEGISRETGEGAA